MTKPPIPDNPISDFMNSTFTGAPDSSWLNMVLVSTLLVGVYSQQLHSSDGPEAHQGPRAGTSLSH